MRGQRMVQEGLEEANKHVAHGGADRSSGRMERGGERKPGQKRREGWSREEMNLYVRTGRNLKASV